MGDASLGTFRIDEHVFPVTALHLVNGQIQVTVRVNVTPANRQFLESVGPGTMTMLFGEDGQLVVRGASPGWALPCPIKAGDTLDVAYRLDVANKLANGVGRSTPARP